MIATNLSPLTASACVAAGGAAGSALRYYLSLVIAKAQAPDSSGAANSGAGISDTAPLFPYATLAVNLAGCLAMGALMGWLMRQSASEAAPYESVRLLLGVGLLGGFTTFSAFGYEIAVLIQRSAFSLAFAYAALSLFGGLLAVFLGLALWAKAA